MEDLKDDRRAAGHAAELLPILGFGYGEPTPREEKHLKRYGLGTEIVALTDERGTDCRMADNYGTIFAGPGNVAKGPLENLSPGPPSLEWDQERTSCGSSVVTDTLKVPRAFMEGLTEAVCYAA